MYEEHFFFFRSSLEEMEHLPPIEVWEMRILLKQRMTGRVLVRKEEWWHSTLLEWRGSVIVEAAIITAEQQRVCRSVTAKLMGGCPQNYPLRPPTPTRCSVFSFFLLHAGNNVNVTYSDGITANYDGLTACSSICTFSKANNAIRNSCAGDCLHAIVYRELRAWIMR